MAKESSGPHRREQQRRRIGGPAPGHQALRNRWSRASSRRAKSPRYLPRRRSPSCRGPPEQPQAAPAAAEEREERHRKNSPNPGHGRRRMRREVSSSSSSSMPSRMTILSLKSLLQQDKPRLVQTPEGAPNIPSPPLTVVLYSSRLRSSLKTTKWC